MEIVVKNEKLTEPESFEPQEALDIMDETADEFGEEESAAAAATTGLALSEAPGEAADNLRRRHRRRGRAGAARGCRGGSRNLPRARRAGNQRRTGRR